ncbi:helix-loop-helix protein delilah [Wyeomyia smithii]|uniref:helix-loop-helix protein delilah n=1 Tax=Wyeomyia smithii TaxID=174621 RepID=UPI002467F539|nr:helix-loop-helix protein delilah [Wyeomyia smithii]XP_055542106.1 helix-loop-helix protein delilah [Wyeomyia smithii]XP_055542107.1 helix-loop-helix protein delilah [Wyeomyia smithii]XP_055542108.1 helix-loop-helix protein delilah [Wyeomyia smithii]XP_055542109.1 helix-loop-helix protein delilah [Wyeomyia smithii]XP_055542110.1 helix-loop-helix protein delilah [Wyeomyia smithii]XP_055542111.1 helix-loop-helix protein delilah [Wyeomyia smithii]
MHHKLEPMASLTFGQMPIMGLADPNNNNNSSNSSSSRSSITSNSGSDEITKKDEKYSLRQRQSRRSVPASVTTKQEKKSAPKEKPKQKAAPLSKYRRKTANARERTRMREINSAFENLRKAVPIVVAGASGNSSPVSSPGQTGSTPCEKLTKITTLRLAMKYIRILNDILNNTDSSLLMDNNNDMDMINHNEIEREVMLKGALLNESIFHPASPLTVKRPPKNSSSKASPAVANAKRKAKKTSKSSASRRKGSSTRSKQANNKTGDVESSLETREELIDLGMMLDSDNDSLNLSEPCLSPLQSNTGLKQTFNSCNTTTTPNELEFGLFLESDADSLQLSEPCLSPLSHLDSLNPFNDLLHTGFNEQAALELYL